MALNAFTILQRRRPATFGALVCLNLFCAFLSASAVTVSSSTSAASVWGIGRHGYTDRTPAKNTKKMKKKTRKQTMESFDASIEEDRPSNKKKKGKRKRNSNSVSIEGPPVEILDDDKASTSSTPVRSITKKSKKRKKKEMQKQNADVASQTRVPLDKVLRKPKKRSKRKIEPALSNNISSKHDHARSIEEDKPSKKRRKASKKRRRTVADRNQESSEASPITVDDSVASDAPAEDHVSQHDAEESQATQTKLLNETASSQEEFETDLPAEENPAEQTDAPTQPHLASDQYFLDFPTDEKLDSADSSLAISAPEVLYESNFEKENLSDDDAGTSHDTERIKAKDTESADAIVDTMDPDLDYQTESMIVSDSISAGQKNHLTDEQDSQKLGTEAKKDSNDKPDDNGDMPAQDNAELDRRIDELIDENGEADDAISPSLASVAESDDKTSEESAAVEEGRATDNVEEEAAAEPIDVKETAGDKCEIETVDDAKVESNVDTSLETKDRFAVDDGEDVKRPAKEGLEGMSESLEGLESITSITEDNNSLHGQDTVEVTEVATEIEKDEGAITEPNDEKNADGDDDNQEDHRTLAEPKDEENVDGDDNNQEDERAEEEPNDDENADGDDDHQEDDRAEEEQKDQENGDGDGSNQKDERAEEEQKDQENGDGDGSNQKDERAEAEPKDEQYADGDDDYQEDERAGAEQKDDENADDDDDDDDDGKGIDKNDNDYQHLGVTPLKSQSSIDVEIKEESVLAASAENDNTAASSADFQSTTLTHDPITIESIESYCDDPSDLTCSIVTWNLAEESPSEEEAAFLKQFRGNDIVLISGQECENIKPRRAEGRRSREFRRLMIKYLGSDYVPVALHMLGGIQFGLFCKRSMLKDVQLVSVADVTCGIGNVFHNKGAIAAFVTLQNKSNAQSLRLLFVTAHMAAHVKNTEARNSDFWRIVSELEEQVPAQFLAPRAPEVECTGEYLLNSVDRIFFCGDLNYRIDLPREIVEHTVRKERENGKLDSTALQKLLRHDQLKAVMAEGLAFPGFAEGKISFEPTFKYDKGTQDFDTSPKQRIPAWTDRVLFKPKGTRVTAYDSVPRASHSDHRPVFASFRVSRTTSEFKPRRRKRKR
ncbi:inositol polyphosphate 5-phosphatase INPP5B/F [Fistulifera solaris]|uniref:Inositol polyphosphate 5-phosphatase INPP5B/F n=1 Tax=Fistulifera solaris TaxID=1519565 RepID=A0A1Z5JN91_FISSO|nr:inositol polyphosphate 5-phosphatase INPP5B/F [Fistulifera solaris]|eukprot:GAX15477.1 inositol polyphosphate 5-phosphatase INPP5B/F [Fistulifera solaris]